MILLAIESSTSVCSVVLAENAEIITSREVKDGYQHARLLTRFIEEMLHETGLRGKDIGAVAVSRGPGSYTGLRIGVSAAKGICFAFNIPFVAVSALYAMALQVQSQCNPGDFVIPMIDARRMEVYREIYNHNIHLIQPVEPVIVDAGTFDSFADSGKVIIIGDGIAKFHDTFTLSQNIILKPEIFPQARFLLEPAIRLIEQDKTDDLAYFEPTYVKDFVAGKPRVKGLL